jgi:hypothetical protein
MGGQDNAAENYFQKLGLDNWSGMFSRSEHARK